MRSNSLRAGILVCNLIVAILVFKKPLGGLSTFQASIVLSLVVLAFLWFWRGGFVFSIDPIERAYIALCFLIVMSWVASGGIPQENINFFGSIGGNTEYLVLRFTIHGVLTLIVLILGYRLAKLLACSDSDAQRTLMWALVFLSCSSAVTILVWLKETGGVISRYNFDPPISGSQLLSPYISGLGTLIATCLMLSVALTRGRKFWLLIALFILGLSTIIILARTAFVINVITFLLFFLLTFMRSSKTSRRKILFGGILGSTVMAIFFYASGFWESFILLGSADYVGAIDRKIMIYQALSVFSERPFWGVGFGYETPYLTQPTFYRDEVQYLSSVHNGFVSLLLQWGIIGMLVYAFFISRIALFYFRGWRKAETPFCRGMCALSLSIIGADVVNMIIGQNMIIPLTMPAMVQTSFILWFLFGITSGLINCSSSGRSKADTAA